MGEAGEFEVKDTQGSESAERSEKQPFIEPRISAPVDVLEATTFFQAVESGATN
jgi:hypothetical protein